MINLIRQSINLQIIKSTNQPINQSTMNGFKGLISFKFNYYFDLSIFKSSNYQINQLTNQLIPNLPLHWIFSSRGTSR